MNMSMIHAGRIEELDDEDVLVSATSIRTVSRSSRPERLRQQAQSWRRREEDDGDEEEEEEDCTFDVTEEDESEEDAAAYNTR